jgi:putative FmdB family regulatory protein
VPTYEYACQRCGRHIEIVQSFRDDPLTTCEACGGELHKVFGSIGIVFKGSGFYRNDSRSSTSSSRSGSSSVDTSTATSSETSTTTKSTSSSTTDTSAKSASA